MPAALFAPFGFRRFWHRPYPLSARSRTPPCPSGSNFSSNSVEVLVSRLTETLAATLLVPTIFASIVSITRLSLLFLSLVSFHHLSDNAGTARIAFVGKKIELFVNNGDRRLAHAPSTGTGNQKLNCHHFFREQPQPSGVDHNAGSRSSFQGPRLTKGCCLFERSLHEHP